MISIPVDSMRSSELCIIINGGRVWQVDSASGLTFLGLFLDIFSVSELAFGGNV